MLCRDLMGKDQKGADGDERTEHDSTLCHNVRGNGFDLSSSRVVPFTHVSLAITEGYVMDMMGRVGLIEIPILIAPDQKVWMDRMIKEGKIAIPPGGTLEKGSLYSMFIRMLLHNAMEEQKRQEVLDAEDEDDE